MDQSYEFTEGVCNLLLNEYEGEIFKTDVKKDRIIKYLLGEKKLTFIDLLSSSIITIRF